VSGAVSVLLPGRKAEAIWRLLNDPRDGPYWQASWEGAVRFSPKFEKRAWRESRAGSAGLVFVLEAREEPRRLALRQAEGGGLWVHELAEEAGGVRVTLREEGEVKRAGGLLGWLSGGGGDAREPLLRDLAARAACAGARVERF
jgi:hypothetical protein